MEQWKLHAMFGKKRNKKEDIHMIYIDFQQPPTQQKPSKRIQKVKWLNLAHI